MCINRDNSPPTCLCGCSLMCGIITVAVLEGLGLVSAVASLEPFSIMGSVIQIAPLICLFIWKESYTVRQVNYIWQLCGFIFTVTALVVAIFLIEFWDVPSHVCYGASMDAYLGEDRELTQCEKQARMWIWIIWGVAVLLVAPLQFQIVRMFKAYRDELKPEEYSELPADDREAQAV